MDIHRALPQEAAKYCEEGGREPDGPPLREEKRDPGADRTGGQVPAKCDPGVKTSRGTRTGKARPWREDIP